ncbi:hypothetical protein ACFL9U_14430, partial [Thermodesulfobacteriota bacterium]
YEEREETRGVLGVESEIANNTVAYGEYRLDGGSGGARNQKIIGLRNAFMLGHNITGNVAIEHLNTISGERRQSEPDAFAISTGLEYLPWDDLKFTTRLEYRNESSVQTRDTYLGEFGAGYRLSPQYSLLFKERLFLDDIREDGQHLTNRTILGLAYRPVVCDGLNVIGKLEYKRDDDTLSEPRFRTDAFIPSVEGIFQANKRLQFIGKYAGKWVFDDSFDAYTDLVSGRILYDINDRFDVGVEYRLLTSYAADNYYHGGSAEIGYRLIKNLWLSLGYSFDDFDADLSGDSYRGYGPYLKLRFKFDENILHGLKGKDTSQ